MAACDDDGDGDGDDDGDVIVLTLGIISNFLLQRKKCKVSIEFSRSPLFKILI